MALLCSSVLGYKAQGGTSDVLICQYFTTALPPVIMHQLHPSWMHDVLELIPCILSLAVLGKSKGSLSRQSLQRFHGAYNICFIS